MKCPVVIFWTLDQLDDASGVFLAGIVGLVKGPEDNYLGIS